MNSGKKTARSAHSRTRTQDVHAQSTQHFHMHGENKCHVERLQLDDGVSLIRSHCCPTTALRESVLRECGGPTLVITFGLSGRSRYESRRGAALDFRPGWTTLAAFTSTAGERHFAAGQAVRQLRLILDEAALVRYLGTGLTPRLVGQSGFRPLGERATPSWCRTLLWQLTATDINPIDRHIAALMLLGECLRPLRAEISDGHAPRTPRSADARKLLLAHELMQSQLDRNLTISQLSRAVGLNECRFKQGFREHYGTTPFQALLALRMTRARALLEAGCQVSQVAYAVGYAHPASFSAAFSRYFGRVPKSVCGNRSGGDVERP